MKTLFLTLTAISLSWPAVFLAGTAYDKQKPVSAYQFYSCCGWAHYELRGVQAEDKSK